MDTMKTMLITAVVLASAYAATALEGTLGLVVDGLLLLVALACISLALSSSARDYLSSVTQALVAYVFPREREKEKGDESLL